MMDQGRTGSDGSFMLKGEASDPLPFDDIDPFFKVYHRCNKPTMQMCDTKNKFALPQLKRYFNGSAFNFGTVNMETVFKATETDCVH